MIQKIKTENREEWKALRKNYIGGSDAAAVVGMNSFSSPFAVWAEKTGRIPEFGGNLATEVGTFLEEFVAKKFEEETGKQVRRNNMSMVNDQYPWAIANIDRQIVGEDAGLEIKTTSELNMKSFKGEEYPGNYYVQCMHYLAVTGKARWYLAVLIGNKDFRIFTIDRDEDEIKALMLAEREFWEFVKNDVPPPVDGKNCTTEAVKDMFPDAAGGSSVDLTDFAGDLIQRKALNDQIKALKEQVDEIDNTIKLAMGTYESGAAPGWSVTWKNQASSALDKDAIKRDYPGIDFGKYQKTSRVMRVTAKKIK
jgi:putative phage-type endonuclease